MLNSEIGVSSLLETAHQAKRFLTDFSSEHYQTVVTPH